MLYHRQTTSFKIIIEEKYIPYLYNNAMGKKERFKQTKCLNVLTHYVSIPQILKRSS